MNNCSFLTSPDMSFHFSFLALSVSFPFSLSARLGSEWLITDLNLVVNRIVLSKMVLYIEKIFLKKKSVINKNKVLDCEGVLRSLHKHIVFFSVCDRTHDSPLWDKGFPTGPSFSNLSWWLPRPSESAETLFKYLSLPLAPNMWKLAALSFSSYDHHHGNSRNTSFQHCNDLKMLECGAII